VLTWGVKGLQPQISHHQQIPVVELEIGIGRGTFAMGHDRRAQQPAELLRRGEMVGMGVGVDDIADAQSVLQRERAIPVDLADLRVDERARERLRTAQQIGLASACGDLLEDHRCPPAPYFGCGTMRR